MAKTTKTRTIGLFGRLRRWFGRLIAPTRSKAGQPRPAPARAKTPPRLTVSIIATSNAIKAGGYAEQLSRLDDVRILVNAAVGSSHPVLLPVMMDQALETPPDLCLIDFCVNEQHAVNAGLYDFTETPLAVDALLARCHAIGTRVLAILIPSIAPDGTEQRHSVDVWRQLCIDKGIAFIDVGALARQFAGEDFARHWSDQYHLDPELSRHLAEAILNFGVTLKSAEAERDIRPIHGYRLVDGFHDHPHVVRNRMFRRTFWRFDPGTPYTIEAGEKATLVGVSFNAAHTNCALEISGDRTAVKRLDNRLFNPSRGMWHMVWVLLSPVVSSSGRFTLSAVASDPDAGQESNDHRMELASTFAAHYATHPMQMELAGLVLRLEPRPAPVDRLTGPVDLVLSTPAPAAE